MTKITDLTELTAVDKSDILVIVDDPSGSPVTKKATCLNVVGDTLSGAAAGNIGIGTATPISTSMLDVAGAFTVSNGAGSASTFRVNQDGAVFLRSNAVTIASDAITAVGSYVILDTEGGAATDNLATITYSGALGGQILVLTTASSSRDVTVKHGTGNIYLHLATDMTLASTAEIIVLMYVAAASGWVELCRRKAS